jgi:hypothetical protein
LYLHADDEFSRRKPEQRHSRQNPIHQGAHFAGVGVLGKEMIFIVVVRRALCEICHKCFDLKAEEKPPDKCKLCGSTDWLYGSEGSDSRYIRQGIKTAKRVLDKSAKDLKRQERGKRQVSDGLGGRGGTGGFQVKQGPERVIK